MCDGHFMILPTFCEVGNILFTKHENQSQQRWSNRTAYLSVVSSGAVRIRGYACCCQLSYLIK